MQNWQIFDFHTHIFPDQVAEKAITTLSGMHSEFNAHYDGTKAGLVQSLEANGYQGALNCPIATKVDQVDSINQWAAENNQWPVLSFGSIHPDTVDKTTVLKKIKDSGLKGIKLHPEFQAFTLEDERMQEVWSACQELELIVLLHSGKDALFLPPPKVEPKNVAWLVETYPELTVVAAHFGAWNQWDKVETDLIGKRVYLDLAYTLKLISDVKLVNLIRLHGVDKVLYGTDAPWQEQGAFFEHFRYLPLTLTEKQQILWDNAKNLLDLKDI